MKQAEKNHVHRHLRSKVSNVINRGAIKTFKAAIQRQNDNVKYKFTLLAMLGGILWTLNWVGVCGREYHSMYHTLTLSQIMSSCILRLYSRPDAIDSCPIPDLLVSRNFSSVAVSCLIVVNDTLF